MFRVRICLLVVLIVTTTSVTSAEDYILPTGVTVLTEEQLLNQIIGNTLVAGSESWVDYYELPASDEKKGRLKGKAGVPGYYEGDWTIHGALMCLHYDKMSMVAFNDCYTIALDGDIVTWYKTTGFPWYNRHPPLKLISGNYKNF
jgi:hypothetical protein